MAKWKAIKIWDDSDCWIIGGGYSIIPQFNLKRALAPNSLKEFIAFGDLLKPYLGNKRVIGINNAFMLGSWIDVAFWGDKQQYLRYKGHYDKFAGLKVTCHPRFQNNKEFPAIKWAQRNPRKMFGISKNKYYVSWNKSSGACAINLAWHLGAKRIFLLGFDMMSDPKLNRSHWHAGYPDKRNTVTAADKKRGKRETIRHPKTENKPPYGRHLKCFKQLSADAEKYGIEIINVNPNSVISQFPKAKASDYFPELRRKNAS